jgi:cellulose synthase/poly-beta-1,6-N-acetylglucosamine synthase-like glycosyltransferase
MYILEVILLLYFSYVTGYSFLFSFAALFYRNEKPPEAKVKRRIAVLIPAYKEDTVIVGVASRALNQHYPADKFDVVIIADSLKPATVEQLRQLPIKVVEVAFEKSTKVRALNKAMSVIGDDYEYAVVLDADNIMESHFLRKMNNLCEIGYRAIQGRREPKNENNQMAVLDGLSETINNFIYRQGNIALGLSSSLNGSGMFFEYRTFRQILSKMDSIGGFDRELEYKLIERNRPVYYAQDVVVYDEKVDNPEVFERQRRRWISSQFYYLNKFFKKGFQNLFKGNFNYFNATVLRNIQLPRLLNLGLLTSVVFISILLHKFVTVQPQIWVMLLALSLITMLIAIPGKLYNKQLLKSALMVPAIFFRMMTLMFKLKGANKTFIHTPHAQAHTTTDPKNV